MRKLFIILMCSVLALFASYAGYRGYRVWKNKHLMSLAHQFLAKSDTRNAALAVQEVLHSNPYNLDANRVMADLTDAAHSTGALLWRSKVVDLNPHSLRDRLALVQTALVLRDYAAATNALEGADPVDKQTAGYNNIAGAVAAAINKPAEAEAYFLEASRIDPLDQAPQLNLAVVRLQGTNAADLAKARTILQFLASSTTNATLRSQSLRELTIDAMRHTNMETALSLSEQLTQETNSAFADSILRLEVLQQAHNTSFKPTLVGFQRQAAADPAKIYELANWEMAKTSPRDTVAWLRSLPLEVQTNQPVALLVARCYEASKDWPNLHAWLEKQRWGDLEFLRHAFLSHALRQQELPDAAKTEWEQAVNMANGQKQSLVMLLRLAAQWNWVTEGQDLLWTIVNRYPQEKWAKQALTQTLYAGGQTRSLMELFNQELKKSPSDLTAKNNLALVALLLDAKELKPNDLAREAYQQVPSNSFFAGTYAYSLYTQGKKTEALKVMQQLTPQDLERPSTAGYYGIILKATGDNAKAAIYLEKASKGTFLLPEERKLFAQAKG